MLLAVNFHYVQPEGRYPFPGIYPTPAEQLDNQLSALGRAFEFISGADLARAVTDGSPLPEQACLITFDDGLKEQCTEAAPVLERHGVSGVFFVCTQPLLEGVGLAVHKMHRLRATRPPEVFLEQAVEVAEMIGIPFDILQVDDEAASKQYLYDDMPTKRIKYFLNHVLPFEDYKRLIAALFSREFDEGDFCREMYMRGEHIQALAEKHTIGSHSHFHGPLATFSKDVLQDSLIRSREALEDASGKRVSLISYPYGGPTAVNPDVARVAREAGFRAGFTMERSVNRSLEMPLLLARVSTNDAPGGKAPLIVSRGDGRGFDFHEPITAYRTTYFDEREHLAHSTEGATGS
jgi:peptidoglycan/xylan/chitin deacetylase (PgdA/CDA1 family)